MSSIIYEQQYVTLGRSQVVRQGTLTPSSAGSSPAVPAKFHLYSSVSFKKNISGYVMKSISGYAEKDSLLFVMIQIICFMNMIR